MLNEIEKKSMEIVKRLNKAAETRQGLKLSKQEVLILIDTLFSMNLLIEKMQKDIDAKDWNLAQLGYVESEEGPKDG